MRRSIVCLALLACARPAPPPAAAPPPQAYPPARRADVVDDHHGQKIADPYRWLEAMDSPETRAWVAAQNAIADSYFAPLPLRAPLAKRLGELMRYERLGVPSRRGSHYFWTRNDGHQNQRVVLTAASLDEEPSPLLDPNTMATAGSVFQGMAISDDGALIAYGLAAGGGDWRRWRVRTVATRQDLPDELAHNKYYRPAFTRDHKAVYYSRFPAPAAGTELTAPDHHCKVYLHRLGTPVADDVVVHERPDQPTWQFDPEVTRDGRYLVITTGDGQVGDRGEEQIVYLDLEKPRAKVVPLIDHYDFEYVFLGNEGPVFYFKTTWGAPKKRIISIDTRAPARDRWKEVIPEGKNAIDDASLVGRQLLVTALDDAHSAVTAYDLDGKKLRDVPLPGLGTAVGFSGGPDDEETFFLFTSFTVPGAIHRYQLASGATRPWRSPAVKFDPAAFETKQIFYASKDGTKVPLFITARKGLALDGQNPTLLTGYGFGGVPSTPFFDASKIAWLERGGILALANIRGGGEYGEAWHHAAYRTRRQVGIDDFLAAAEWLVANRYTSPAHLGVIGTSGGGMLVGAATMQRPDLIGASVPIAGVHDLLRFQLFGQGAGWQGDMGSPDNAPEMKALLGYSPLHNVRPGTRYPPTLIITGDHDVRVAPLHSYKLAAAMQAAQASAAPVLLRVQISSGHGGGSMLTQRINQETEILSFLANTLGLRGPETRDGSKAP
jgi:prolyl oligopeptidase